MATKITTGLIDSGAITSALITDASITADDLHTTLDLTGKTVTVATATAGDNDTSVASTAFVATAIANLADSAPSTLDTLNELAAALGDDANYATTTTNAIALKAPLASPAFNSGTANVVASFTSTDGTGAIQLADNAGNVELAAVGNDFHIQNAGSAAKMVVLNSGNVGIGTTSPTFTATSFKGIEVEVSGDLFPNVRLERVSGSSKTNQAYEMLIGSGGNWHVRNATTASAPLSIATDDSIHMTGNVGIGLTPKAYHSDYKAIDINNSASVMGYTGNNGAWLMENLYFGTDGNWKHKNSDFSSAVEMYDGVFNFYNTASGTADATATLQNRLKIDASGNVGIGTSNPSSYYSRSLVVSATAEQGITIAATGTSMSNYLMFADGTTGNEQYRGYIAYSHTNDRMAFASAGEEKMYINSSGSVGIGTDSPDTNLHVKGSNNSAGDLFTQVGPGNCPSITIQNAGTTDNNNAALYFRDDQDMRGSINMRFTNHSTHASELRFATTLANNTREKFIMTAEGQLGINKMAGFGTGGFGTPMLVIKQKVNSAWGGINVEANGNDSIFSISCPDSGATLNTSYRTSANHKPLNIMCAGQSGIEIGTGGFVRIGSGNVASNAQSHQLHVDSGNIGYGIKIESQYGQGTEGSNNSSYYHHDTDRSMYYWNKACYANGGFHTYSDSRLKENVTAVTGALDKVALMNGVTFTWDNSEKVRGPEGKQFGVLAQNMLEVDSALPTLNVDPLEEQDNINDSEQDTDYYSMDYSRLTPFFIEAIKELKTKLEAAEARIATLEG